MVMLLQRPLLPMSQKPLPMPAPREELAFTEPPLMVILLTRAGAISGIATANAGTVIRTGIYRTITNGNVTTRAADHFRPEPRPLPMPAPPEELAFTEPPLMVMLLQEPFTASRQLPAPQAYGAEFWGS